LRVGETDIEIAPKFLNAASGSWQTVLWRILAVVEGGHVDERLTTAHNLDSVGLPDLLAEMFLASYSKGAARGLPRGYQTEIATGPVLRGAFDVARLGEWIARPWDVPYVADRLTDDTAIARLLHWTAECLSSTVTSPGRARALREVVSALSHVGHRPPHLFDAQRITLGTLHQALEPARLVGVLMLEGAGVHHAAGDHALSGFLWNSDVIYENYIYWLCQRAAGRRRGMIRKSVVKFGEVISGPGSRLATTPDVVFSDAWNNVLAVTDSKYKRFGTRPKAPDTYQVLTAAHVLGCQRVSLTYPVDRWTERTVWRVGSGLGGADIEMTALPLNLMALLEPNGSASLVDSIVEWLEADLFAGAAVKSNEPPPTQRTYI
jgi:5-methylcytosine-specific restriction endonuclease McrBC regulatory subunit McrC